MVRFGRHNAFVLAILAWIMGWYASIFAAVTTPSPTKAPVARPTVRPTASPTARPTTIVSVNDPVLTGFKLDRKFGSYTLTFDRLIMANTFDIAGVSIQPKSSMNTTSSSFIISKTFNKLSDQGNTTSLIIFITSGDYARLMSQSVVGVKLSNSYLTLARGSVYSTDGYMNKEVSMSSAFQATEIVQDVNPPFPLSFSLNMNTGILFMTFSKPLLTSSFMLSGLTFQSLKNSLSIGLYANLVNQGMSFVKSENYNRDITMSIGNTNLNLIKAKVGLCNAQENCYISAWQPFVKDVSGNNVSTVAFERVYGMAITDGGFTPDTTPSTLKYWDLDLNTGSIILYFSETVYLSYFNYSCISLVSSNSTTAGRTSLRVSSPINPSIVNSDVVYVYLNTDQLNGLKDSDTLCRTSASCFLVLDPAAVVDTAEPANVYQGIDATTSKPMGIRTFVPDTTPPSVVSYSIDLNSRLLSITFTEIVNVKSVVLTSLTLQSDRTIDANTEAVVFSSNIGTVITTSNAVTLKIMLTVTGFAYIKSSKYLGKARGYVYLAMKSTFITDKATTPNAVQAISTALALQASSYKADYTRPYLMSWYPDMSYDRLVLTFSEPMNITTFDVTKIILSSEGSYTASAVSYTLSKDSYVYDSVLNVVRVQLSDYDSIMVKSSPPLCLSGGTCFITFPDRLSVDTMSFDGDTMDISVSSQNQVVPTELNGCGTYAVDTMPPYLKSFKVDLSTRTLYMVFSEPVFGKYINMSGISLHGSGSARLSTTSFTTSVTQNTVLVYLTRKDFIGLKSAPIYTGVRDDGKYEVFITLDSTTITDIAGNAVTAITNKRSMAANKFVTDSVNPQLQAVFRDPLNHNITLYFDNPMDVVNANYPIDFSGIKITADGVNSVSFKEVLSNSITSDVDFNLLTIKTSMSNLGIGQSQDSTFIMINKKGSIVGYPEGNPVETVKTKMREGETFISFRMNMNTGVIRLEMVVSSTFSKVDPTLITLISTITSRSVTLTSPLTISYISTDFVDLTLNSVDLANIKSTLYPLQDESSVKIRIASKAFLDTRGRYLQTSTFLNLYCGLLVKDVIPPEISSFTLDMSQGTLQLFFSEPVRASQFSYSSISLVNSKVNATNIITLTNATSLNSLTNTLFVSDVTITLNDGNFPTLRDRLHLSKAVGYSKSNTYLIVSSGFVGDSAYPANYMAAISRSNALQASSVKVDATPPVLSYFDLDLNTRRLTLRFNEAVNISTNKPSFYYLLQDPTNTLCRQRVIGNSTTIGTQRVGREVVISLSTQDVDAMMYVAPNLAIKPSNTYLAFKAAAIYDIAFTPNPIEVQVFRYAYPVRVYTYDITPPVMTSFDFSLQESFMDFYFNEVVNCLSVNVRKIIIQFAKFAGTSSQQYRFSNASSADCTGLIYDKHVRINIALDDLNAIKSYRRIAKARNTTFIRLERGSFYDASGNSVIDVIDGFTTMANNYYPDTVSPVLLSFTISTQKVLTLVFNEPVDTNTISIGQFFFQDGMPTYTKSYSLITTTLSSADTYKMNLQFLLQSDYDRITIDSSIFTSQTKTWMRANSKAIKDMAGNALETISAANALALGPTIKAWDLDMNTGVITLVFSEDMNSSFSVNTMAVQSTYHFPNISWTLSTSSYVSRYSTTKTTFTKTLSSRDINGIKLYQVASSASNAYLTAPMGITKSLIAGTIIPYLKSVQIRTNRALPVRKYVKDITAPIMKSFELDLNNGYLLLIFDEPILASSVQLSALTLISSTVGTSATISDVKRNVTLQNYTSIKIYTSGSDLSRIKKANVLGTKLDNLVLTAKGAMDFASNYYVGNDVDHPIWISKYSPDTTSPIIVTVTVDLSMGLIKLLFDEYVDFDYIYPTNFSILSTYNYSTADRVDFTDYSVIDTDSDGSVIINMGLYSYDKNNVMSNIAIGTSVNDSYISMVGIQDLAGNKLSGRHVYQATTFISDTVPLQVTSFDLEMKNGMAYITIYFQKGAKLSTFSCSDFRFRSLPENNDLYDFTPSTTDCTLDSTVDDSQLSFHVTNTSLFDGIVGKFENSTYLNVPKIGNLTDFYGNHLDVIWPVKALRQGPQVIKFIMNMNEGVLTLIFSKEIMRKGSFDASKIGLYSAVTRKSEYLTSGSTTLGPLFSTSSDNDTVAVLTLSTSDFNRIKLIDMQSTKTYLVINENALYDTMGQSLAPLTSRNRILVSKYIPDVQRPVILNASLDLGSEFLTLTLSEPLRSTSFKVTNLRIQSSATSSANSYKLTGGSIVVTKDSVTVSLLTSDSAAMKLQTGLAKNSSTAFLSFAFQTASDMSGNYLQTITTTNARAFDSFVLDKKSPSILKFDLDMTTAIVTFYMSEPCRASSLNITQLTFLSRYSKRDGASYRLTGGTVLTSDSTIMKVKLTDSDMKAMKNIAGLVRTKQSSYIIITSDFIQDLFFNDVVAIVNGAALGCSKYTRDSIAPVIQTSIFDFDDFSITFYMSEPVPLDYVNPTALTFQSIQTSIGEYYALTSASYVIRSAEFSDIVKIHIANIDMDSLKSRFPLLSNLKYSFYSLTSKFLIDTSMNAINAIPQYSSSAISDLHADTVVPLLKTYELDLNMGSMRLVFSEAVSRLNYDLTQLVLQTTTVRRFANSTTFDDSFAVFGVDGNSIQMTILISENTLNTIKSLGIATLNKNSYLSWTDRFVSDYGGNYLPPRWDGSVQGFTPLLPDKYTADSTSPTLLRWYIDRTTMRLHWFFDEPVQVVDLSKVVLYSTSMVSNVIGHHLSKELTSSYATFGTEVIVQLTDVCSSWSQLGDIANTCSLFSKVRSFAQGKLYMSFTSAAFSDRAAVPNAVESVEVTAKKVEGGPVCSDCPFGQYTSQKCTANSDRVCSVCSTCSEGKFTQVQCKQYQDTQCSVCGSCPLGEYISSPCTTSSNVQCSTCTKCDALQYEISECINGHDAVCGTCKKCIFQTLTERLTCESGDWMWWALSNCCYDESGTQQPCNTVDRANMVLASRDGRHHWAFEKTSPAVTGKQYAFGMSW